MEERVTERKSEKRGVGSETAGKKRCLVELWREKASLYSIEARQTFSRNL